MTHITVRLIEYHFYFCIFMGMLAITFIAVGAVNVLWKLVQELIKK